MLSRNKVAVPEGVAGTPPFWSLILYQKKLFILILCWYIFYFVHLFPFFKNIKLKSEAKAEQSREARKARKPEALKPMGGVEAKIRKTVS